MQQISFKQVRLYNMKKRFVAIWFRHLITDRTIRRQPELLDVPFVIAAKERGRMVVKAANLAAENNGIFTGMVVADAKAVFPSLHVIENTPQPADELLSALAEWCLRYTPVVATDSPDGLLLDVSGCAHLWGGERLYLKDIITKLRAFGYDVRAAIADTIGAAWAIARYGKVTAIIEPGTQLDSLLPLPPAALRLEAATLQRMYKLGLHKVGSFINMPRTALRRRFGSDILIRLDQALGKEPEIILPINPVLPYMERLPAMEPICTAKGIEIALRKLLDALCERLSKDGKGLRNCLLKCYRIDNKIEEVEIGTNSASRNQQHLFKLFESKLPGIEPALGIELFTLEASIVEGMAVPQEVLWKSNQNDVVTVAELLDRIVSKLGANVIHRYLPDEHHWPERCVKLATSFQQNPDTEKLL
jgi:protein ImuB